MWVGVLGTLFGDLILKYQEKVQTKSKSKQGLHLVKSFPGKDVNGWKDVIRTSKDGEIQYWKFNVCGPGCCCSC